MDRTWWKYLRCNSCVFVSSVWSGCHLMRLVRFLNIFDPSFFALVDFILFNFVAFNFDKKHSYREHLKYLANLNGLNVNASSIFCTQSWKMFWHWLKIFLGFGNSKILRFVSTLTSPYIKAPLSFLTSLSCCPLFPSFTLNRLSQHTPRFISAPTRIYHIEAVHFPLPVSTACRLSSSSSLARRQKAWPLFFKGHCNNKLM